MTIKSIDMAWIVVNDLNKAVNFYTDVVGMTLKELNPEFGWAELSGKEGKTRLGIAERNEDESIQPGQNAVVTFTVESLDNAIQSLSQKGAHMVGEPMVIPHMVKLQMVKDVDNNHFQLVELIQSKRECCGGCH